MDKPLNSGDAPLNRSSLSTAQGAPSKNRSSLSTAQGAPWKNRSSPSRAQGAPGELLKHVINPGAHFAPETSTGSNRIIHNPKALVGLGLRTSIIEFAVSWQEFLGAMFYANVYGHAAGV